MNVLFRLGAWTTLLVLRATKRWPWRQSSMRWASEDWRVGTKWKKSWEPIYQNNLSKKPRQKDEERIWKYGTQYQLTNNSDAFSATGRSEAGLQEVLRPLSKGDETPAQKVRKNNVFFLQDYSFQICDYLQVSRGRSNSGPTRGVSLVEVNSPTNRLPNHLSTQWRS